MSSIVMILKSVGCNSQPGSPWQGKIHQDQPLLQQHTTAATFDTTVGTAGLAQHLWQNWGSNPGFWGWCGDAYPTEPNTPSVSILRLGTVWCVVWGFWQSGSENILIGQHCYKCVLLSFVVMIGMPSGLSLKVHYNTLYLFDSRSWCND